MNRPDEENKKSVGKHIGGFDFPKLKVPGDSGNSAETFPSSEKKNHFSPPPEAIKLFPVLFTYIISFFSA